MELRVLDPAQGGAFSSLAASQGSLLTTFSDDLTFWQDSGDVYGATFGNIIARESDTNAQIEILAEGPLLARARITFSLNGQPVTISQANPTANAALSAVQTAVAVEALSDHPLAAAIVRDGTERLKGPAAKATDLKSITGRGVEAVVDGAAPASDPAGSPHIHPSAS